MPSGTKICVPSDKSREQRLEKLLREAVKIIHCHSRNLNKEWLQRARKELQL